jgi:DNA polymerase-1
MLPTFKTIYVVDFEYNAIDGEPLEEVHCMVAREWRTGATICLNADELARLDAPPFPIGPDTLYVCYYATAEMGAHLALGWPLPVNVLDLYVEFRNRTNGLKCPLGAGLLGALSFYGLNAMDAAEKDEMRQLALRGGPYSFDEQAALRDYCLADVEAETGLLTAMLHRQDIDVGRALLRGRYMAALSHVERAGVPLDLDALSELRDGWQDVKAGLVAQVDREYGIFDGLTFREARFEQWLAREGLGWPRLPTGRLRLDEDTFRDRAKGHPSLENLRQLRYSLSQLCLEDLAVGGDGRNRCMLSPFRARTGRNQPSNTKFIFGPAVWLRGLIRPTEGHGLAYIDWSQQELGIAAALSEDPNLSEAYNTGDPYLSFARMAGAVPADATKETHPIERDLFKQCALAVQYGMGARSLGARIGVSEAEARRLLQLHRRTFPIFWKWSDAALAHASGYGWLGTQFGWCLRIEGELREPSLRNFPMQANGSEMLRLAIIRAVEDGVRVVAPVHDALLIEAPLNVLDDHIHRTQAAMRQASTDVLAGFELESDAKILRYPDRYRDERGIEMWNKVWGLLNPERCHHLSDGALFDELETAARWCEPGRLEAFVNGQT